MDLVDVFLDVNRQTASHAAAPGGIGTCVCVVFHTRCGYGRSADQSGVMLGGLFRDMDVAFATAARKRPCVPLCCRTPFVRFSCKATRCTLWSRQRYAPLLVPHAAWLCAEQGAGLLGGLFGGADAALRGAGREAALRAAGLPHTIVRFSQIQDCAGGASYIEFSQADDAAPGPIAREDAALVLARALAFPPARAQGVAFAAGSAGPGVPPSKEEWGDMFGRLNATVSAVAVP